jgi:hypothetical protein
MTTLNKFFVGDKVKIEGLVTGIDVDGTHVTVKPITTGCAQIVETKIGLGNYITLTDEQRRAVATGPSNHPVDAVVRITERGFAADRCTVMSDNILFTSYYCRCYRLATADEISAFVAKETASRGAKEFDSVIKKVDTLSIEQSLALNLAVNEHLAKIYRAEKN